MKQIDQAVTHAGHFHADDVFGAALLRIVYPKIEIRRVTSLPPKFSGLAFDIGGGEFDHHGPKRKLRPNGVPYAAFGLLWKVYGPDLVGAEQAAWMDEHFIQPLDRDDNTGCGDSLADAIGVFNPVWDSADKPDVCFWRAERFAAAVLENRIETARAMIRARGLVDEAIGRMQDGIVVLPRYMPWRSFVMKSEAKLVIYPSQRSGFCAQGVPVPDSPQHALRCRFPANWCGLEFAKLEQASGIRGLTFCHASGFLVCGSSAAAVTEACRAALAAQEAKEGAPAAAAT